jgi:general secretion pathway protein F
MGLKKTTQSSNKIGKPKRRDIIIVLHELATLLESDIALIEAIESLASSTHHPFITQTFANIAAQLRQGTALFCDIANV